MGSVRYFHLYADNKRIREISWEEFCRIHRENFRRMNRKKLARLYANGDLYIHKHPGSTWISGAQLKQILEKGS